MQNRLPKVEVKDLRSTGRASPWLVIYYRNRKAKKRYFGTEAEAEAHKKEILRSWRMGSDPESVAAATRIAAGTGYALDVLTKAGLEALRSAGATSLSPTATIAEGGKLYLERQAERNVKDISKTSATALIACLNKHFGHRIALTITVPEVREFLKGLPDRKGNPGKASTDTKLHYYRILRGVLFALGVEKPLKGLQKPRPSSEEKVVDYFDVNTITKAFRIVRPEERGMLVMAVFGGFRPHLLEQLPPECVDPVKKTIFIPNYLAKDGKDHDLETEAFVGDRYVPGLPEVIWDWLKVFPFKPCPWVPFQHRLRKGLGRWIQDGLRHSAATFYCKLHGRSATALLLTHEGENLVLKHYVGICRREDAERFYALDPNLFIGPALIVKQDVRKQIEWPSDNDLAAMLQESSALKVAKLLGCSDVSIWKRCKKRGIPKPGKGEWNRRKFGDAFRERGDLEGDTPAA